MNLYKTPVKAIRAKCLDCCCNQYSEVTNCTVVKCALYPYRLGKRPNEATIDTLKKAKDESEHPS
jgi:hypothetical protein